MFLHDGRLDELHDDDRNHDRYRYIPDPYPNILAHDSVVLPMPL
jgi:hypothetical protein